MKVAIVLVFIAVFLTDGWLFIIRPRKPLRDKLSFYFQIVAAYTFAFGLLAQTRLLASFGSLARDMTSPNLFEFFSGNFAFLGLVFSGLSLAFEPIKEAYGPLYLLEMIVLLILGPLSFVYAVFHLLVIAPFTYIGYLLVDVPLHAITTSAKDILFSIGDQSVSLKTVVSENIVSLRNFTVAVPAMSIALLSKMIDLLRHRKGGGQEEPR